MKLICLQSMLYKEVPEDFNGQPSLLVNIDWSLFDRGRGQLILSVP